MSMPQVEIDNDPSEVKFEEQISPPAPESPLDGLKEKLQAVRDKIYVDLEVPRWIDAPPEGRGMPIRVFVRYRPVSSGEISAVNEKFSKGKPAPDWRAQANAQLLIDACIGIYAMSPEHVEVPIGERNPGDGICLSLKEGSPDGAWTRFDVDLGQMLGVKEQSSHAVLRGTKTPDGKDYVDHGLYLTDGDVDMATIALLDWSAKTPEEAAQGFSTP